MKKKVVMVRIDEELNNELEGLLVLYNKTFPIVASNKSNAIRWGMQLLIQEMRRVLREKGVLEDPTLPSPPWVS